MTYPTRRTARRAAYRSAVTERNFRLHQVEGGWDFELVEDVALSEHVNPTFEFHNREELESAELGRIYKAAMSMGISDVCTIPRHDLINIVHARLLEDGYDLGRVTPVDEDVVEPSKPRAEGGTSRTGAVAFVWKIADSMPDAPRRAVIAACVEAGINKSTAGTQYSAWRKERQPSPAPKAVAVPGAETSKTGSTTMATKKASKRTKKSDDAAATDGAEQTETKAEKPAREALVSQNGVSRPRSGSATARVWEIADEISKEEKRPARRKEVIAAFTGEDGNPSTGATQYGRWRKFHGLTKEDTAEPAAESAE